MDDVPRLDAYRFYEEEWDGYDDLYEAFEWEIPDRFNTAGYVCDRHARDKGRAALFAETMDGPDGVLTFWRLRNRANALANHLESRGVGRGDRVVVTGIQKPETLIAMVAAWKLGAVAVPVSAMFGTDGLRYRLSDSEATAFVVDESNADTVASIDLDPDLHTVGVGGAAGVADVAFRDAVEASPTEFETVATDPDDPATIMYTSGTTGDPKGTVLAHRTLLGALPGFVFTHMNMDVREEDVIWVLAEWSWIGLYGWVLPALYFGRPVVGLARESFDPEKVFDVVEKYGVTYFAGSPTAYRMLMQTDASGYDLDTMRVVSLGGEKPGRSIIEWIAEEFGDPAVNVAYGQTECAIPIGECAALGVTREDSMGVAIPGHEVRILDPETVEPTVPEGEVGEIGIRYEGDPLPFTEYLNKPEKTAEKVRNGWLRTEDLGWRDGDGFLYFRSRTDDVIISSGYRIGPEEIEETLSAHPAVVAAGVIGVPDDTRGEIVKAFVELADGYGASADLREELKDHVRERLAQYEYPREIEFMDELPKTTTEKIQRSRLREIEGIE